MRTLNLDYVAPPTTWRRGSALFIAGTVLLLIAVREYREVRHEVSAQQYVVSQLRKAGAAAALDVLPSGVRRGRSADEVGSPSAPDAPLFPWDELFAGLESAKSERVGLLAIEPDAEKHVVKLTAEAGICVRHARLCESSAVLRRFADVVLASHHAKQTDSSKPVRFIVTAAGKSKP
jgi:hypothetical protein